MSGIHDGHRDRMRERIQKYGLDSLQDHEVLEWLLYHTIPRGDVNALAHRLIKEFGSFHDVLEGGYDSLLQVPGVGEKTALFLSNLTGVSSRFSQSKQKQNIRKFRNLQDVAQYVRVAFVNDPDERLHALMLSNDLHLIRDEIISYGIFSQVPFDWRSLMVQCVNTKAAYVVLAHNHPSNILFPSSEDIRQTGEVSKLLQRMEIKLLDHFIVGQDGVNSLRDSKEYNYLFLE